MIKPGYSLVIAEKPDAGRRIAKALGRPKVTNVEGVEVLDVQDSFDRAHYVVCSASGHLFGLTDSSGKIRSIYPTFDVAWAPISSILSRRRKHKANSLRYSSSASFYKRRINVISRLSKQAASFIHACDYDLEGETIGYNILNFACGLSTLDNCKRAKFSTLAESDVRQSFSHLEKLGDSVALAGRTRHVIDFIWGVNLSRALTDAYSKCNRGYRNLSIGRVQGPTLSFVADREIEINAHVPLPFWKIFLFLRRGTVRFETEHERKKINTKSEADSIIETSRASTLATVKSVERIRVKKEPPIPFNLGELQSESFRRFGFVPSMTLKVAEKLYLRGLISYPRTNSQKLPASIGYQKVTQGLSSMQEYTEIVREIMKTGRCFPIQGLKEDSAHPAIHPTGEIAYGLDSGERKVYDLIVRRFLATFGEDALFLETFIRFLVGGYVFCASGKRLLHEGWMKIYPNNWSEMAAVLPELKVGETLNVESARLDCKFEQRPSRFNQIATVKLMEDQGLGTKGTRADIVSTLIERGYVIEKSKRDLEASEMGLQLVETMRGHCKEIVSVDLTRRIESEIERISQRKGTQSSILEQTKAAVVSAIEAIRKRQVEIGLELAQAGRIALENIPNIGKCPICTGGYLRIVKSLKTKKRFIGCSNFSKGCKASSPLPRKGSLSIQRKTCPECKWPMVSSSFGSARHPWIFCPNLGCPARLSK